MTCLLYPYDDYRRYDKEFLVSGGADFAVKLWDIFTGDLLYTFSTHAGELLRLLCTPSNCSVSLLFKALQKPTKQNFFTDLAKINIKKFAHRIKFK